MNEDVPALSALNMRLRDDYVADAAAGVDRWNRVFAQTGIDFRITLPHVAFNRRIGEFAAVHADTDGRVMSSEAWEQREARPCCRPRTTTLFIASLMRPVREPRRLRVLDRPAALWNRQPAGRFRIREDRGLRPRERGSAVQSAAAVSAF